MWLRRMTGVLMLWLAGSAVALHADELGAESIGVGVVEETDFASGTMLIEGYRYRFAPDIPVQIGGSAGAVVLLEPGMRVQFRFVRVPDGPRELLEVRQVPAGVRIDRT